MLTDRAVKEGLFGFPTTIGRRLRGFRTEHARERGDCCAKRARREKRLGASGNVRLSGDGPVFGFPRLGRTLFSRGQEGRLGSVSAEPSLAAPEHREHRVDRPGAAICPNAAQASRHPRAPGGTPHPPPPQPTRPQPEVPTQGRVSTSSSSNPPHGSRSRAPPASAAYLDGLSSAVVAVLYVGHRPPHPEGLLSHHADDPRMIGTRSIPILRHERQRAKRQPAIRVRLREPLDRLAR